MIPTNLEPRGLDSYSNHHRRKSPKTNSLADKVMEIAKTCTDEEGTLPLILSHRILAKPLDFNVPLYFLILVTVPLA